VLGKKKTNRKIDESLKLQFLDQRFPMFAEMGETTDCSSKIICVKRFLHDVRSIISAAADSPQHDRP